MGLIQLEYKEMIVDKCETRMIEFSKSLLKKPYNEKSLFIVKVEGESMQPLISDEALIVVDLSQKVLDDKGIYLVNKDNRMWVKQARTIDGETDFVSINKAFSHLVYPLDEVYVLGKVLLTFTNL